MVYLYNPEHNVPVWNFLFFNLKKKNKTKWRASCLKEKLLKRPGIPYMKWRASPPFWGDCMRWRFNLPPSWQMQSCRVSSFYRLFLFPPPTSLSVQTFFVSTYNRLYYLCINTRFRYSSLCTTIQQFKTNCLPFFFFFPLFLSASHYSFESFRYTSATML